MADRWLEARLSCRSAVIVVQTSGSVPFNVLDCTCSVLRAVRALHDGGNGPVRVLPCSRSDWRVVTKLMEAGAGPERPEELRSMRVMTPEVQTTLVHELVQGSPAEAFQEVRKAGLLSSVLTVRREREGPGGDGGVGEGGDGSGGKGLGGGSGGGEGGGEGGGSGG